MMLTIVPFEQIYPFVFGEPSITKARATDLKDYL